MGTVKCTGQVGPASPMAIEPQGARRRTHAGPTLKVMFAHRFVKTQRELAPVACRECPPFMLLKANLINKSMEPTVDITNLYSSEVACWEPTQQ